MGCETLAPNKGLATELPSDTPACNLMRLS
jgi:hypothetical protein